MNTSQNLHRGNSVDARAWKEAEFSRGAAAFSGSKCFVLKWTETNLSAKSSEAHIHKVITIHLVSVFCCCAEETEIN